MGQAWFVGVDESLDEVVVCTLNEEGSVRDEKQVKYRRAELKRWIGALQELGGEVHVALENPHGLIVFLLLEAGIRVWTINPKQVDRFRDRFSPSGSKDDRRDARVQADALRTDRRAFREVVVQPATAMVLKALGARHEQLSEDRVRLGNRIRTEFLRLRPEFRDYPLDSRWSVEVLKWMVECELAGKPVKEAELAKKLKSFRVRRFQAKALLELWVEPESAVPAEFYAASLRTSLAFLEQLSLVEKLLNEWEAEVAAVFKSIEESSDGPSDASLLRTLPGVGTIVLTTLLGEGWEVFERRELQALRSYCGTAAVTEQSGRSRIVKMRRACNMALRDAVYHWSRVAMQHDAYARHLYKALRARGHTHGRSLRGLADRLLAIAVAMLREGKPYDPARAARRLGPQAMSSAA